MNENPPSRQNITLRRTQKNQLTVAAINQETAKVWKYYLGRNIVAVIVTGKKSMSINKKWINRGPHSNLVP